MTERVLPHGPLVQVRPDLYMVSGQLPHGTVGRRMAIIRLKPDNRLLVYSAMRLSEAAMKEVEELGEVGVVIVPNGWHRMDAAWYRERYPRALFLGPEDFRERIEKAVKLGGVVESDWPADISNTVPIFLEGLKRNEALLLQRDADRTSTLIVADLFFNVPPKSAYDGFWARLFGSTGPLKITRIARFFFVNDLPRLKASLGRLVEEERVERLIMAHGEPILEEVAPQLRNI